MALWWERPSPPMWLGFVTSSRVSKTVFLRVLMFPSPSPTPPQENNTPNSNSTRIEDKRENQLRLMWLHLNRLLLKPIGLCSEVCVIGKSFAAGI